MLTFLLDFRVQLRVVTQVSRYGDQPAQPRTPDALAEGSPSADLNHKVDLLAVCKRGDFLVPFRSRVVVDCLDDISGGAEPYERFQCDLDL